MQHVEAWKKQVAYTFFYLLFTIDQHGEMVADASAFYCFRLAVYRKFTTFLAVDKGLQLPTRTHEHHAGHSYSGWRTKIHIMLGKPKDKYDQTKNGCT